MKLYSDVTASPDDRRDALRQAAARGTKVEMDLGDGEVFTAEVLDVSRTGIRLCSVQPLNIGTVVTIRPPASAGIRPCSAEVVRETPVDDDGSQWFDCGLRFIDLVSEERHHWFLRLRHSDAA